MATLNSYIRGTVELDYRTNTVNLVCEAISTIPVGIIELSGKVRFRQPDGLEVEKLLSVEHIYPLRMVGSVPLRRDISGKAQVGEFKATFIIDANGYDQTTHTAQLSSTYQQRDIVLTELFNYFTPQLRVNDETIYQFVNWAMTTFSKTWQIKAGAIAEGNSATTGAIDLSIAGLYYDTDYKVSGAVTLAYTSAVNSNFTIKDTWRVSNSTFKTLKIPAYADLVNYIEFLRTQTWGGRYPAHIQKALSDFDLVSASICGVVSEMTSDAYANIAKTYWGVKGGYTNSGDSLNAFDFSFCSNVGAPVSSNYIQNTSTPQSAQINITGKASIGTVPAGDADTPFVLLQPEDSPEIQKISKDALLAGYALSGDLDSVAASVGVLTGTVGAFTGEVTALGDQQQQTAADLDALQLQVDNLELGGGDGSGWTPVFIDQVFDGKVLKKLLTYIGGVGTPPTANVGDYLLSGGVGYTDDPNLAGNFSGGTLPGWSAVFVSEAGPGGKTMKKLVAYVGGTGTPPTENIGMYLTSAGGFTSDTGLAGNFPDTGGGLEYNDDFDI